MVKKKKKKKKISTRLKRLMKWRMQTERKKRNNFLILAGGQLSKRGAKREPVQSLCKRERKDRRDKSDELNFQEKWNYTHGKRATHNRLWTHGWTRRSFSKRKREINCANRENREEKIGGEKKDKLSSNFYTFLCLRTNLTDNYARTIQDNNFLRTNLSIFEHDFEKTSKSLDRQTLSPKNGSLIRTVNAAELRGTVLSLSPFILGLSFASESARDFFNLGRSEFWKNRTRSSLMDSIAIAIASRPLTGGGSRVWQRLADWMEGASFEY